MKLNASGMTFGNLDESKTVRKKLRKPEEQLHTFMNGLETKTKKSFNSIFSEIKTTEQSASGRMSANKIIIQIFK